MPGAPACPMTPADSFWHADVSDAARSRAVRDLDLEHRPDGGTEGRLRRGAVERWADRHPVHDRSRHAAESSRVVHVRRRERRWSVSRSRLTPRSRAGRARRAIGTCSSSIETRAGCGSCTARTHKRAARRGRPDRARPGISTRTRCVRSAGHRVTPRVYRSFRDSSATTRSRPATIDHVIRFTAPRTANAYVWPASHKAATGGSSDPPMGAWFRLKASYDISRFSAPNQVILRALKKHGMVLADNGSPFFMSGAPDAGWNDSDLNALRTVPGSAFEAVDVSSLRVSSTSYAVDRRNAAAPTAASAPSAASATATSAGRARGESRVRDEPQRMGAREPSYAPCPEHASWRTVAPAPPSSVARSQAVTRCSTTHPTPSPRRSRERPMSPRRGCGRPRDEP